MTVEGIKLTPLLIKSIRMYQENPDVLNHQLETFDKVIHLLAIYGENAEPNDAASIIKIISDLCYFKTIFQRFSGEGENIST